MGRRLLPGGTSIPDCRTDRQTVLIWDTNHTHPDTQQNRRIQSMQVGILFELAVWVSHFFLFGPSRPPSTSAFELHWNQQQAEVQEMSPRLLLRTVSRRRLSDVEAAPSPSPGTSRVAAAAA